MPESSFHLWLGGGAPDLKRCSKNVVNCENKSDEKTGPTVVTRREKGSPSNATPASQPARCRASPAGESWLKSVKGTRERELIYLATPSESQDSTPAPVAGPLRGEPTWVHWSPSRPPFIDGGSEMSSGGWAMPTLRCPSMPEAARERRERLSHPLGWLFSEGSREPRRSRRSRGWDACSLRSLPWRQAPTRGHGHRCHPHSDEDQAGAVKPTRWIYTQGVRGEAAGKEAWQ